MYTGTLIPPDVRRGGLQIAAGFGAWYAVHGLLRKLRVFRDQTGELSAISLIHAVGATSCAVVRFPWDYVLALCTSYFMYDSVYSYKRLKTDIRLHHACAIIVSVALRDDREVEPLLPILATLELSSIFLSSIYVLRHFNMENTRAALVAKALFAATFIAVRIIWLPPKLWREMSAGGALAGFGGASRAALAALIGANFCWLPSIVRKIQRALRGP